MWELEWASESELEWESGMVFPRILHCRRTIRCRQLLVVQSRSMKYRRRTQEKLQLSANWTLKCFQSRPGSKLGRLRSRTREATQSESWKQKQFGKCGCALSRLRMWSESRGKSFYKHFV